MTLFDNLLTVTILVGLFLMIYIKYTGKTLIEIFRGVKELLSEGGEEYE